MHLRIRFDYCRDHYNQRELCDDYRNHRVHIVSPACLGKANFPVGLTLDYPGYPKGTLGEGREMGEKANRTQTVQTLLPEVPQTALPMNPEYMEFAEGPPPDATLLRQRCLEVFELHFKWVLQRLQQGEELTEWPRLFFNLDQEGQFPVSQMIDVLRELRDAPEAICEIYEKLFENPETMDRHMHPMLPFLEVRYATCP